jgi:hypothetical protein
VRAILERFGLRNSDPTSTRRPPERDDILDDPVTTPLALGRAPR